MDKNELSDFVIAHNFHGCPNDAEEKAATILLEQGSSYAEAAAEIVATRSEYACEPCEDSAGIYNEATHRAPYADGGSALVCDDHLSRWYEDCEGLPPAQRI